MESAMGTPVARLEIRAGFQYEGDGLQKDIRLFPEWSNP
jgi:hypothetical protein